MKATTQITAALCLWLALHITAQASPQMMKEIHIGLSPYHPPEEATAIRRRVSRFALEAPPSTVITVHDAYALTQVARFQVPNLSFDSPEERARRMAEPFAELAKWYEQAARAKPTPLLENSGAMRTPEFLQSLSGQIVSRPCAVLLIGSPIALSVEEPTFSMVGGKVPSDGHLTTNRTASIYGTAGQAGRLQGCTIHFCYLHEGIWQTQLLKENIQRFWALFISQQSGVLADFTGDLNCGFSSVIQHGLPTVEAYTLDPADHALEMRVVQERKIPLWTAKLTTVTNVAILAPVAPPLPPLSAAQVAKPEPALVPPPITVVAAPLPPPRVAPPPAPTATPPAPKQEPADKSAVKTQAATPVPMEIPTPAVGNIGIAAVWSAERSTDIDLWVAAKPGLPEAYWHSPRVERVRYFRDIRTSQRVKENTQWQQAWEYAEIEGAQVAEPTVWLNVYVASGPVSGIVRVQFNGRVVDRPFKFDVRRGNRGQDSNPSARVRSPYWQEVKLADFFPDTLVQTNPRSP